MSAGPGSPVDMLGRCKGHLWDWVRDDYTTSRYRCRNCGRERGVFKRRVPEFEAKTRASGNKVPLVGVRRPAD